MLRKNLTTLIGLSVLILTWAVLMFVYMGHQPVHAQSQPYKWDRMKWIGAWHGNTYATQVWCDLKTKKEIYVSRDGIVTLAGSFCE
jgi:hypothetical protein